MSSDKITLKILNKTLLLILRTIYLAFLFILLCVMSIILPICLMSIFATSALDVETVSFFSCVPAICLITNLLAGLIAYKIDKFTFKCHMVMAGICAVCIAPPWVALLFV